MKICAIRRERRVNLAWEKSYQAKFSSEFLIAEVYGCNGMIVETKRNGKFVFQENNANSRSVVLLIARARICGVRSL